MVELVQHVRHRPVDDAEALVAAVAFGLTILGAAGKCGGSGGLVLLAVLHLLAPRGRG